MGVVFRLVAILAKLLVYPLLLLRRARAAPAGGFLELTIDGRVVDIVPPRRLLSFRARRSFSVQALSELVDELVTDPKVRGLLVRVTGLQLGMAVGESLRGALARVRAAGRELVVHFPLGADTKETFVGVAASRLVLGPQATLSPLGFAVGAPYLKGALDRAGIAPEVLAQGRYKSAGEQLVREGMSEAQREQLEAVVDRSYRTLVEAISEGRKVGPERARAMIDGAPYLGREAVEAGLADAVAYEDELPAMLGNAQSPVRLVGAARYLRARRAARLPRLRPLPVIGVVRVHGAIAHGSARFGAGVATDESVIAAVRVARSSRRVRGVVLHVDSPGGSALASDRIHHEIVQLAAEKPVVACLANVAASGGYYVAVAAHAIVARPTTVTGSIGVVSARVALDRLLQRLGIVAEVVKRGAHADLLNVARPLSAEERTTLERELRGVYRAFLGVVSEGRKRPIEEIGRVAEGRVWTGADAHERGLVDELGGFEAAIARVRAQLGKGAEALPPAVVRAPLRAVPPLEPPPKRAAEWIDAFRVLAPRAWVELELVLLAHDRERVLAWSPEAAQLS